MFTFASLAWFAFALFSLVSLVRPIKPFGNRKQVLLISPIILLFWLAGIGLASTSSIDTLKQMTVAGEETHSSAESVEPDTAPLPKTIASKFADKSAENTTVLPGTWNGEIPWYGWPDGVKRANDALVLHYLKTDRYDPVSCRNKQIEGFIFIRCQPTGTSLIGGVYIVTNAFGSLAIFPFNGKAQTHTDDRKFLTDVEDKPIRLLQRDDPGFMDLRLKAPLSKAIEEFQK